MVSTFILRLRQGQQRRFPFLPYLLLPVSRFFLSTRVLPKSAINFNRDLPLLLCQRCSCIGSCHDGCISDNTRPGLTMVLVDGKMGCRFLFSPLKPPGRSSKTGFNCLHVEGSHPPIPRDFFGAVGKSIEKTEVPSPTIGLRVLWRKGIRDERRTWILHRMSK